MARSFQRVLSALLFSALIPGSAHGVEPLWFDAPPPPRRARALTTDFLAPLAAEALPAVVMLSVTGPVHHHEDSTGGVFVMMHRARHREHDDSGKRLRSEGREEVRGQGPRPSRRRGRVKPEGLDSVGAARNQGAEEEGGEHPLK